MRRSHVLKTSLLMLTLTLGAISIARADFELTDKKGRRVLLKDNGTWRFIEPKDGAASAPEAKVELNTDNLIELQLLRRFDAPGGCRFDLSLANNLPHEVKNLVPDFIALRSNGAVYGSTLSSFAAVKPGESRNRSIQFAGIACTEIAKLQVTGADRCEMGELNKFTESKGKCLSTIRVLPSDLLKFEK
ncbi:hypothetical protein [Roseateles oligotrophus]|uniref:DUF4340 domain-containing protein n=1 Tax=Roseateles oligotrophus TaxID=1769250 RepID=A0ABT2YB78_9BURK|nr:hypothetical protein [Roseateles oligotrophus]MCV2367559.1 hypothetical protein [Roseateles oligotrophus]